MGFSAAKSLQGVGVSVDDAIGRDPHPVTVPATSDVLTHRPTGCVLHRNPLSVGAFPQRRLLFLSQSKRHRHLDMVSD